MNVLDKRWLGALLVGASLIALFLAGYSSYQTLSYAKCQSMVTEQLILANNARALAADEDRRSDRLESDATALLIRTVFTSPTVADRVAAYDAYQATMAHIAEDRAATARYREDHPVPDPPSQACA